MRATVLPDVKTGIAALLAAAWALGAPGAEAATVPDNLTPAVKYRVVGKITTSCALTQGAREVELVDLQDSATNTVRAASADLQFTIACNAPVRVSMTSHNGGLKAQGGETSDRDFASLVPYRATLDLPGAPNALQCDSDDMDGAARGCARRIEAEAFDGAGRIRLNTVASDALLLAGTYQDSVTLTISPRLGGAGPDGEEE